MANQKNIHVENGDVAGRDIFKDINLDITVYSGPVSQMTALTQALLAEVQNNQKIAEYVPKLAHYMKSMDSDDVVGLEEKLSNADMEDEISGALLAKEEIAKRLERHSTYRSAQKIYILLMGSVLERFKTYVTPKIDSGIDNAELRITIFEFVLAPIVEMLEHNVLEMYIDDIWGLIYYLTGNCHIQWVPD